MVSSPTHFAPRSIFAWIRSSSFRLHQLHRPGDRGPTPNRRLRSSRSLRLPRLHRHPCASQRTACRDSSPTPTSRRRTLAALVRSSVVLFRRKAVECLSRSPQTRPRTSWAHCHAVLFARAFGCSRSLSRSPLHPVTNSAQRVSPCPVNRRPRIPPFSLSFHPSPHSFPIP
jgi:hypothetical protein